MIPEKTNVSAIIKAKSEAADGFKIELEIASFNSKYPTTVTRVPESIASQLKVGQAANLNLTRQSLKKNQDGTMKSGNFWSDYYWGLEGIAQNAPAPVATPMLTTAAAQGMTFPPFPVHPNTRDLRDESIKQQVAVKEVGAMLCAKHSVPEDVIEKYWDTVREWLQCGPVDHTMPNPPSTPQNVPPAQSGDIFWPHFNTIGDMMTYGTKQGVLMQEFASFLGVKAITEWKGTPDDAWSIIATKKNLKPEHAK